ncbi:hypothetical protein ABS71_06950 [bacterium SCN 62-11]|nr:AI-2E family transporter [Candidatus Eremiobacteraeota bacterium]ODT73546.1 MAG: hypothetical protein ABS71_06950 [bacterium SCN 62-11]
MNSRWILLLGLTAVMLQLCWKIITPFLSILLWASVLVLVFYPSYQRILAKLKGRSTLASALTTLLVLATIILPMVVVTGMVVAELESTARELQAEIPRHMERLPDILEVVYRYTGMTQDELKRAVQNGARTSSQTLLGGLLSVVGGALGFLVNLGFVSFTMFYLFIDGDKAVQTLREWLPLERSQSHALLVRAGEIISASVYGVVVLAMIQGSLGGLMFWWLGLPSPLLWGVVMILFATIPMLGTFVIWVPAAIYLATTGHMIKALILTLWGSVVIGMSDNLLRPTLVGKKAKMHDLMIFFAVLGGLNAFGVLGILMGPVVLAVSLTLLEAFRRADPMRKPDPLVEVELSLSSPIVEPMTVSSPPPPPDPEPTTPEPEPE